MFLFSLKITFSFEREITRTNHAKNPLSELLQTTGKMNYLLRKCRMFIKYLSEKLMKEIEI